MTMLRRTLLIAAPCFGVLAACKPAKPGFNGIDLTGVSYGEDFRLQDAQGQWKTLADYRGKVVMLFFGFTQCPDVCPTALARAAETMKLLGGDAKRVQVLFVTVDPERDTPTILAEYTRNFDPSFVGLYTNPADTKKTADEFKAFYNKVPLKDSAMGYTIDHTALTYAFDPNGRLRLAIRHDTSPQAVAEDVKRLLRG
jgi:protein SCO1/2